MALDLKEFVDRHLSSAHHKVDYNYQELKDLCCKAIEVLKVEKNLVFVESPVVVVGDLHGNYQQLRKIFKKNSEGGANGALTQKFIFLGNYIDYGKQSIATMSLLLGLKVLLPQNYHLLRGSHECYTRSANDGFLDELKKKFGEKDGTSLFKNFNQIFHWLPIAALIDEQELCVHGGISKELRSTYDFQRIPRPLREFQFEYLADDIICSKFDSKRKCFVGPEAEFRNEKIAEFLQDTGIARIICSNTPCNNIPKTFEVSRLRGFSVGHFRINVVFTCFLKCQRFKKNAGYTVITAADEEKEGLISVEIHKKAGRLAE